MLCDSSQRMFSLDPTKAHDSQLRHRYSKAERKQTRHQRKLVNIDTTIKTNSVLAPKKKEVTRALNAKIRGLYEREGNIHKVDRLNKSIYL